MTGAPQHQGGVNPRAARAREALTLLLAAACFLPWATPAMALAAGVVVALLGLAAFQDAGRVWSRRLIQASVVLLGLRLPFDRLVETGASGLAFAAATIIGALALGWVLGRLLRVEGKVATLLSSGTAICGGSAIGAVGTAIGAASGQMAVAMGAVFLLNGAALYLFPIIGHALNLTETQFGTWAGVAIHDVSSVVGAARSYHTGDAASTAAAEVATVVKLSRVIWIVPIALGAAWAHRPRATDRGSARSVPHQAGPAPTAPSSGRWHQRPPFPWFILGFLAASAARTFIPSVAGAAETWGAGVAYAATAAMTLALFLIGAGLSKQAIAGVGWRAMGMAAALWVALAGGSLALIARS